MTRRLLLGYLTVTLIVLLLLELPLAVFYQQRELDRLTVDLERDATVLATIYEDALEDDLPIDPVPAEQYTADTMARVVLVDEVGISLIDTDRDEERDFSTRPEFVDALGGRHSTGTRRSETLDTELLYVAVPVASGGTVHGALRLTFDTHEVTERVWKFWGALVAMGLVVLTVMAGVGWIIARSVTRPIRHLQHTATRFSGGDLTPTVVDTDAPAEIRDLETALNDMARRLDALIEQQRSFVADTSHQLRTPLTALRLRLENLHTAVDDEPTQDELSVAIGETERLATLVGDLLQLARTDKAPPAEPVELLTLVGDRVDIWSATAEQEQVMLRAALPAEPVWAAAIPGGLEQVLDNLLDNAIRAAPPHSTVSVAVTPTDDGRVRIDVVDEGAGIDDADKASALTRFWRSDDSVPGTGLGLAIADAIVRAGGGTIELTDHHPTGLTVSIHLTGHTVPGTV